MRLLDSGFEAAPSTHARQAVDVLEPARPSRTLPIAVLPGEGIGPEVVASALAVLRAIEATSPGLSFELATGGPIGKDSESKGGPALPQDTIALCERTFASGGAVLAGPGGGRFVYDMRRRFDLFCKLSPLVPRAEILGAGRMREEHVRGVDILVVRENTGGIYQGEWRETRNARGARRAEHTFSYDEPTVRRIVRTGARIAAARRGGLAVIVKDGGVPSVSALWRDVSQEEAREAGVAASFVDIDLAAYRLVQEPRAFDVVVASNLYGDVLGDLGGVLLGSRGITFSGNFGPAAEGVYQTNHGAAYDLAGTDRANPVGQIYSLAMLLRESFGLAREASLVEAAVAHAWRSGARTGDLAEPGCRIVGTREMTALICAAIATLARANGTNGAHGTNGTHGTNGRRE